MKKTLLLLILTGLLNIDQGASEPKDTLYNTILFDLKLYNCEKNTGKKINNDLRKNLSAIPCLSLVDIPGNKICSFSEYALETGKTLNAHRAVYGYISVKTDMQKQRLGETGVGKYILKTEKSDTYYIRIKVIDIESGNIIADISKETSPEKIDSTVKEIAADVSRYYSPQEAAEIIPGLSLQPETEPEPEEIQIPEKPELPAEASPAETPVTKEPSKCCEAAAYFSFMFPVGNFSDIASLVLGNTIEGRMQDLLINKSELRLSMGYYYFSVPAGEVNSYSTISLLASGGYRFMLTQQLSIAPLFGLGYHLHFVQNKNYSGTRTYFDPLLSIKCGVDYRLKERLSLTGAAGYSIFFETDRTGMYPLIDLGIKYSF